MNIGWRELRTRRTVTRRLCGHVSGDPSDVLDQSNARVKSPISPPPAKKSLTGSTLPMATPVTRYRIIALQTIVQPRSSEPVIAGWRLLRAPALTVKIRRPESNPSRFLLAFRFDRHDLVAGVAFVNEDERTPSDPGQLSQSGGVASAGFAARRRGVFLERSGHDAESLRQRNMPTRMLTDCILIMEKLPVRLRGA